ncbi:39S ribosomal protein L53 mitochondrial [Biomphalaria glabrata]|uniref:Large ribosomal subunit protein mL53 n=1 Tax=Biomphalaria glabrata TaxID=6526 RepID=A0A2C9KPQ9_BIOGL|nr:39S ribosomal protein L53, mitochondrial-like [Biomphalaria glabrata]KAI8732681.1 39S ribosomal protein L53; mitochondrial-like [Biomphalaria glabrata]KAI8776583.1 39S ribosomal protein L53, mitochondrial [Biomphalaria glabrata]
MAFAIRKATTYLIKRMHLRPVRRVKFTFDPYMKNAVSIRDVASTLHMPDILETNQGTLLKFDIKSDRSEPQMDVEFNDGHKLIFKTGHLTQLEILDYLYELVDEKDPKKSEGPEIATKSSKIGKMKGKKK